MSANNTRKSIAELEEENLRLLHRVRELEARLTITTSTSPNSHMLIEEVFNAAQDAIFVKDLEGRYLLMNKVGAAMLGHTVEECLGVDDASLFPPESAKKIREVDLRVIREGKHSMIEEAVVTANGLTTFLSIKGPFYDTNGTVIGLFGISRDITLRKTSADELRLSEERLNLAQKVGGFGTWDWDVAAKRGSCSPKYAEFFGIDADAPMPTFEDWIKKIHIDDRDRVSRAMIDSHKNHSPYDVEYRIVLPDRPVCWVRARATIFTDSTGDPLRVVGIVTDITPEKEFAVHLENQFKARTEELQLALRELQRTESRYRVLFEGINDGVIVHDHQGRILDCNEVTCRHLGYTREELLSLNTADIDAPEFAAEFDARLAEQRNRRHYRGEGVHLTRDGRRIPIDISSSTMRFLHQDVVLSIFRDISDRKRIEAETRALEEQVRNTQKLESLGLLAGGIAHDFNNLLVGVMGHAEMGRDCVSEDHIIHQELDGILNAAERAASLCNQMLAYSGKGKFIVGPLNVNEAIQDISTLLAASLDKKIHLVFDLDQDLPAVIADAAQITQVILNLMTNAAEAIGANSGTITLKTRRWNCNQPARVRMLLDDELEEGEYVSMLVEDSGTGMDEATIQRIFDPFFTTKFTGRGLGLAAVIGIVRGHRGGIQVCSQPGKGTGFTVYLPASPLAELPIKRPTPVVPALPVQKTILLVDDEPAVLSVARRMLERMGLQVLTAVNGREALTAYQEHHKTIHGVLLDLTMPELNGRETYLELRKINPTVRILLSSGYSNEDVVNELKGGGYVDFIQKPYRSAMLYTKVQKLLSQT